MALFVGGGASGKQILGSFVKPIADLFKPVDKKKQKEVQKRAANAKKSKKNTGASTVYNYNGTDFIGDGSAYSSGGSGGGSGYSSSGSRVPDISGLLAAYDQQADASRKIAQDTYNTTRNDLLTSLKRYQEQHAKDVENQKQSYLSEQSSLESAREAANRQNRVAAAARGLGGSGLQQLAQLQNLMSQGEDISQAATSNQKAMDSLKAALQEKEEDYNTNLSKAQTTLDSALKQIEANLAQQKAEAIYQNEMAKVSGGSGGGSGSGSSTDGFDAIMEATLDDFNSYIQNFAGKTNKQVYNAIKKKYNKTVTNMDQVRTILANEGIKRVGKKAYDGMSSKSYNTAKAKAVAMANSLKGQGSKAAKNAAKKTSKKKKK